MIERKIPNPKNLALKGLLGMAVKENEITLENYTEKLVAFERKCEQSLIETLARVNVKATVKEDRYSLPYSNELEITLMGESYVNGPYEFYRVARRFVKEILEKDLYKIRFYIFISVEEDDSPFGFGMGKVIYKFRYYPHTPIKEEKEAC